MDGGSTRRGVKPTIPDFDWYSAESKRLRLPPRCPFANTNACPRYFQSLSLLGTVGHTPIAEDEDARLLAKWKQNPLWPATDEQATSVTGPKDRLESLNNFCPEVAFDRFGLFASHLGRYADEIDSGSAHQRLAREKAPANHPAWQWSSLYAQHYSECPVYAPLSHDWTKLISPPAAINPSKTTGAAFDVFISHASDPLFRLLVVTSARSRRPVILEFKGSDLDSQFGLTPISFFASKR